MVNPETILDRRPTVSCRRNVERLQAQFGTPLVAIEGEGGIPGDLVEEEIEGTIAIQITPAGGTVVCP